MDVLEYFQQNVLTLDTFSLVAGEKIGSGISRAVYVYRPDPTLVVKFEAARERFENATEWSLWQHVKDVKRVSRWFAPCVAISDSGAVMLQRRVMTAQPREYLDKLPAFLTDTKRSNFGILDGRLVCCDYGTHLMLENGMTARMRKAEWWD